MIPAVIYARNREVLRAVQYHLAFRLKYSDNEFLPSLALDLFCDNSMIQPYYKKQKNGHLCFFQEVPQLIDCIPQITSLLNALRTHILKLDHTWNLILSYHKQNE